MRTWLSFIVFFLAMLVILGGVHYYLWARLIRDALWPARLSLGLTVLLIALFVAMFAAMPLSRVLPREIQFPLSMVGYTWMGVMFVLFVLVLAGDMVRGISVPLALASDFDPSRRLLVQRALAGSIGILGLTIGAVSVRNALQALHVKKVKVPLARLPESLRGYRIVQITDVHVGPTIGREFVEAMVARVNSLNADAIVITGDLVDGSVAELEEHVAPLADLRAREGVFFVPGNHDYYSGLRHWTAHLKTLGIQPLRNERVELGNQTDRFDLVGLDDETGNPDMTAATAGRDKTRAMVVLAHQPRTIREAEGHGAGLQISGHTHGGQIWPFNFLVRLTTPFVVGLYKAAEDMYIYVSPGTGYWGPPMRLGTQAEITEIELV